MSATSRASGDGDGEDVPLIDRAFAVLNSPALSALIFVVTLYLLFGGDVRLLTTTARSDFPFEVVSTVAFFILLVELLVRTVVETEITITDIDEPQSAIEWAGILEGNGSLSAAQRKGQTSVAARLHRALCCGRRRVVTSRGYAFSFLFFLDLISAASIVLEIPWLVTAVAGNTSDDASNNLSTARASRVSRVGSRLGRLIRMARLVRLIRLASLWRRWNLANDASSAGQKHTPQLERWRNALQRQSQMGARLHGAVTAGVILLVLLMLLVLPALSGLAEDPTLDAATKTVHALSQWRGPGWEASVLALLAGLAKWDAQDNVLASDVGTRRLAYASFSPGLNPSDPVWLPVDYPDLYNDVRVGIHALVGGDELLAYELRGSDAAGQPVVTTLFFCERPHVRMSASLTVALTCIVILMLAVGALQLSSDAQSLVLRPIESMIVFLQKASLDPLGKISSRDNTGMYETKVLENTIKKVGMLLPLAFGTDGALVVSKHLDPAAVTDRKQLARGASVALLHSKSVAGRLLASPSLAPVRQGGGGSGGGHKPGAFSASAMNLSASHSFAAAIGGAWAGAAGGGGGTAGPTRTPHGRVWGGKEAGSSASGEGRTDSTVGRLQRFTVPNNSTFDPLVSGRVVDAVVLTVRIPHHDAVTDILGPASTAWRNKVLKLVHDVAVAAGATCISSEDGDSTQFAWCREPGSMGQRAPSAVGKRLLQRHAMARSRRASLGATITGIDASALLAVQPVNNAGRANRANPALRRAAAAASGAGGGDEPLGGGSGGPAPSPRTQSPGQPLLSPSPSLILLDRMESPAATAVRASMHMLAALRRSRDVMECAETRQARTAAGTGGYRPRLELGLHFGKGVECAVGSGHKSGVALLGSVPAASSSLSLLCSHLGCELVLSPALVGMVGPALQPLCRGVDGGAGVGHVYVIDCWDWRGSLPPSTLQDALMTRILPLLATDSNGRFVAGHRGQGRQAVGARGRGGGAGGASNTTRPLSLMAAPECRNADVAGIWASAAALVCGHLSLPAFRTFTDSVHRFGHAADALGLDYTTLSDGQRAVSILGAADIVEHPLRPLPSTDTPQEDPDIWALRAVFPAGWTEQASVPVGAEAGQPEESGMAGAEARWRVLHRIAAALAGSERKPAAPVSALPRIEEDEDGGRSGRDERARLLPDSATDVTGGSSRAGAAGRPTPSSAPTPAQPRLTGLDLDLPARAMLGRLLREQEEGMGGEDRAARAATAPRGRSGTA